MNGLAHLLRSVNPETTPGAPQYADFVALFLLVFLLLTLLVAGLFVWLAIGRAQDRRFWAGIREPAVSSSDSAGYRFQQGLFQPPTSWLAIRTDDTQAVIEFLHLRNPTPCSWEAGVLGDHDKQVFVSPSLNGWVVVLGSVVPDAFSEPDACFHFLKPTSEQFGEVQWFAMNRVLNHHAWVRAINGYMLRAYVWAGETLWNQGELSQAEKSLRIECDDYCDLPRHNEFGLAEVYRHNTEKVSELASLWSVDPACFQQKIMLRGNGVAGNLS